MRETILNLLFPRHCPVCGEIVQPAGRRICPSCLKRLSFVKAPVCKKCGKEISDDTAEYCEDCLSRRRTFEYGVALLNYDETARRSMAQIKYRNKREYLDFYGPALAIRYGKAIRRMGIDVIVPVPVHASRRRARGFNQAELLADILGRQLGIPVQPELLVRKKRTLPQKELTAAERFKNLSGAFRAPNPFPKLRSVLLVDDIYTTGSTIEACTRALKEAGVPCVYFAVLCMTGGR
ncbi:MAG: ComF family protein [Lachnospiraceae bacterium]|jgi:ComF family protein|nr:ComF family protein [Lachnospiraceae bacterium]